MASQVVILSYTIRDDDGVKASAPFWRLIGDTAVLTPSDMIDSWGSFGTLLDAVTGGVIIGGEISFRLPAVGSWKDTPITGQSVSDTLNLNYAVAENLYKTGLVVPALRDTLVSAGRPIVGSGAIANLNTAILTGDAGFLSVNPIGQDYTALVDAFQGVRKHRKQLTANSKVIISG